MTEAKRLAQPRWIMLLTAVIILVFYVSAGVRAETGILYRIPVEGEIDRGLARFIARGLAEAEKAGADLIFLEIDTFGGEVDAAVRIRDNILLSGIPTVTFVRGRAWSAGALIALAGEKLAMTPGSSIGAAETRPREEKYISALRKEFKATAETRGRNPELAAAMVDADLEIPGITEKGKLLTLTASEALEQQLSDYQISDRGEMLEKLGFQPVKTVQLKLSPTENFARFVTRPAISTILLTVGFIALIFEALTLGWGIGGTVGLLSLGAFFSGYIINGAASWGLIVLFLVGLVLLALEVFVVPGFGVTGIGGIVAVFASLYFIFPTPETAFTVLATVLLLTVAGTVVIIKFFGGSRFWKRISLGVSQTREAGYLAQQGKKELVGKTGLAVTPLRPAGIVEIDGERIDVVSEGGFIDREERVKVIKITGNRIVVRPEKRS